jgi:hypothetical protein
MKHFRSNSWLSTRAKKNAKQFRRTIYQTLNITTSERFAIFFKTTNSWWIVLTMLLVSNCIVWLYVPNFTFANITYLGTIERILDDRISDYLALFGVSVAATVFIIQTIQQTKNLQELFSLIFQESGLYPIIAFHLFTILILNFTSLFREYLGCDAVARLVIYNGSMLFIVAIFTTYFLFSSIYRFVGTAHLNNKREEILRYFLIESVVFDYMKFESRNILQNYLKENNINMFSHPSHVFTKRNSIQLTFSVKGYIHDVNIEKIMSIISPYIQRTHHNNLPHDYMNETLTIAAYPIGQHVFNDTTLISLHASLIESENEKRTLQESLLKCFLVRQDKPYEQDISNFQKQLDNRILLAVKDSDVGMVEDALELYHTILDFFSSLGLSRRSSSWYSDNDWTALQWIDSAVRRSFDSISEETTVDLYSKFVYYYRRRVDVAIESRDIQNLRGNIYYVSMYYQHSRKRNFNKDLFKSAISHYTYYFYAIDSALAESNSIEEVDKLNAITNHILTAIAQLLRDLIEGNDEHRYEQVLNILKSISIHDVVIKIEQIENGGEQFVGNRRRVNLDTETENLRDSLNIYVFYMKSLRFLVWAWLVGKYDAEHITYAQYQQFENIFKNFTDEYGQIDEFDFLFTWCDREEHILNVSNWEFEEQQLGVVHIRMGGAESWILFAFTIHLIRSDKYTSSLVNRIAETEEFNWWSERLISPMRVIEKNPMKWLKVVGKDNIDELNKAIARVQDLITVLKERSEAQIQTRILNTPLHQPLIEETVEEVITARSKNLYVFDIAKHFNLVGLSNPSRESKHKNSIIRYEPSIYYSTRCWFIDDPHYSGYGGHHFGMSFANHQNQIFINKLVGILDPNANELLPFRKSNLSEAITHLLYLRQGKVTNLLIILGQRYGWRLQQLPKFKKDDSNNSNTFFGTYNGISCVELSNYREERDLPELIIACDITKLLHYTEYIHPEWTHGSFNVQIGGFDNDEMATEFIERLGANKADWLIDKKTGQMLTETELIRKLRSAIQFIIEEDIEIIVNSDKESIDAVRIIDDYEV